MDSLVIGFGYKARHGKDFCVQAIVDHRGKTNGGKYDVRRYSFAQELKREVTEAATKAGGMDKLFESLRYSPAVKTSLPEWVQLDANPDMSDPDCPLGKQRTLLQWWGTDFRRAQDPYYWVKRLARRLEAENPQVALISDMRFKNEFYWVKSTGGYTVKVTREGYEVADSGHASEHDLDGVTFDIEITRPSGQLEGLKEDALRAFDVCADWFTQRDLLDDLDFSVPTEVA